MPLYHWYSKTVKCSVREAKYFKIQSKKLLRIADRNLTSNKKGREKKKVANLAILLQIGDEIGNRTFICLGLMITGYLFLEFSVVMRTTIVLLRFSWNFTGKGR